MGLRIFKRLRDLIDVDAANIGDGKIPVYRSASGKHEYETGGGGAPSGAAGGVLGGTYPNPSFAADMATQAELDAHTGDTSDAHDASAISILDTAADFTATDVEGALAELQSDHETDATNLSDHIADSSAAHAATAISNAPAGSIAATTVQAAIDELAGDVGSQPVEITQAAHGFVVGDVLRLSGATYVKALASSAAGAEAVGIVSAVAGVNAFTLTLGGKLTGLSGLTAGSVYFLSDSVAGALTATEPTAAGSVTKPLLIAYSTTAGYVFNFRGLLLEAALTAADVANTPAGSIAATTVQAAINELDTEKQPLDSDLTAIAALSPSNDDFVQRKAGAWTNRTVAQVLSDLGIAAAYQPLDSDLTAIAALTTTAYGRSLLAAADASALRTLAGTVIGTDVQAALDQTDGQSGVVVPTIKGWVGINASFTTPRLYSSRFVLLKDRTVSSIRFRSNTAGTGNVDVCIFNTAGTVLRSSGSTAGKKGANTWQTVSLSSGIALTAGTVYYVGICTDTSDGSYNAVFWNASTGLGYDQMWGSTLGLLQSFYYTLPAFPIGTPTVAVTSANGAVGPLVGLV